MPDVGHATHAAMLADLATLFQTLQVNGTLVVNPGSVGLSRDGDPRAAYAIIDGDEVQLKRIEYPIEETVQAVEALTPDEAARHMLIEVFRTGGLPTKWLRNGTNGNGAH